MSTVTEVHTLRAKTTGTLLMLLLALCSSFPAGAAPAGFNEGVGAYNARKYKEALAYFTQAAKAAPTDPTIRYYMGLTYQGLNQMTLARQQYEWVSTCRTNPALAQQAGAALQGLSRYQTPRAGSSSPAATSAASSSSAGSSVQISGRLKILYFTADW